MKERSVITRDGNSRVARLNTPTFPLLQPVTVGCIVWQPVRLKLTGTSRRIIICTRVHLCLCVALSVFLSSVDVIRSFTYVLRVVIWTSLKFVGRRAREKARGNNKRPLACTIKKKRKEIKPGTSGCGSFVIPYFQPSTSIDRLQIVSTTILGVNDTHVSEP